jgi:hypothetical protein
MSAEKLGGIGKSFIGGTNPKAGLFCEHMANVRY